METELRFVPKMVQVIGYVEGFRYNTALCKTK